LLGERCPSRLVGGQCGPVGTDGGGDGGRRNEGRLPGCAGRSARQHRLRLTDGQTTQPVTFRSPAESTVQKDARQNLERMPTRYMRPIVSDRVGLMSIPVLVGGAATGSTLSSMGWPGWRAAVLSLQ